MKRFKEILAKNVHAHAVKEATEHNCDAPTLEEIQKDLEEDSQSEEAQIIMNSIKEWYKEKTGQELTEE